MKPRTAALIRGRWIPGALLAWTSFGALAEAPGGDRYPYTVARGETIYGIAHRLLEVPVPWRALQASNGIAEPTRLRPGQTLQIPVAWLRRENLGAAVVAAEGDARADLAGQGIVLGPGVILRPGTRITTGSAGAVALRLADGTTLQVQAATEVELERLQRVIETATYDDRLQVRKGRVVVAAASRKGPAAKLEVVTPRAVSGVRGTEFRVGASERASLLEVLAGGVASRGGEASAVPLDVAAGEGVAYDATATGAPKVVKLLPAPEIEALAPTHNGTPVPIRFAVVEGAIGYRVQLALDAGFERVIDERVTPGPDYRTPEIADGAYWARVRAIDASGLEGRDAAAGFAVAARPRPPFSLVGPEHGKVRATVVRFEWTGAMGAVAYRFQLAGDRTMAPLLRDEAHVAATLLEVELPLTEADYHWRLASIDAGGKQGPWSEVFKLERRPQAAQLDRPAMDDSELALRWPGSDGQSFEVQVARDAAFTSGRRDFEARSPELRLPRPAPGEHFVRVRDVDAAGNAGPWSDPQRIEVPFDYRPLLLLLFLGVLLL